MKNKALRITLTVAVSVLLAIISILALVKIGERIVFFSFYAKSTTEFKVPGTADGFIQQGFEKITVDGKELYLTSGYMKKEHSSRVYITDAKGKSLGYTKLRDENGERNTTHAGGIAVYGDYVYVTNGADDKGIEIFLLKDILDENNDVAWCVGTLDVQLAPAFVYVDSQNKTLYTGSFHRDNSVYLSPEKHKALGAEYGNTALILAYDITNDGKAISASPKEAYTTPSQVQGMTFTDSGKLVLSTSWGVSKSHLLVYDFAEIKKGEDKTTLFGAEIPLYHVTNAIDDVKAPPMAEELVYDDGKVYIMNESASAKYIFGKFTSGNYVHTYKVD